MALARENTEESEEQRRRISSNGIITLPRQSSLGSGRFVTDGNWCILFIFIFIIWITSWCYYAIFHPVRPDLKIDSTNNSSVTKNETELTRYFFWGRSWIFDTITCNLAFISVHYENSGSIVIIANAFLSIALLAYSISSMGNTYMFQSQLNRAYFYLAFYTLFFRLLAFSANYFVDGSIMNILIKPSHEKLLLWLMPEIICITVWYTKKCYNNKDCFLEYHDELRELNFALIVFVAISLGTLGSLLICSMNIAHKLGWDRLLPYLIVGGSCYIGLAIFYFLLIVLSSAIYHAPDFSYFGTIINVFGYQDYSEFWYAFIMVARYHFGTACYHATLIFPRLHSLFVVNEPEFREKPGYAKFINRFYATQCKLHSLSLMSTAVGGTNHSDSMRGLMRHFATDIPPKLQYFQRFSQITRSSLSLLMSTNSLTVITFWFCGLDNPRLSLSTWVFYARLMITFIVPMTVYDMAADTILLIRKTPRNQYDLHEGLTPLPE